MAAENALGEHPDFFGSAALGVPDAEYGQRFDPIRRHTTFDENALRDCLRARVS